MLYGRTLDRSTGEPRFLRVKPDNGSDLNLISARLVQDCNFKRTKVSKVIIGIGGHRMHLEKLVKLRVAGPGQRTRVVEFYEVPAVSPVDELLVGKEFERKFEDPFTFFWHELPKEALVAVQEEMTVSDVTRTVFRRIDIIDDYLGRRASRTRTHTSPAPTEDRRIRKEKEGEEEQATVAIFRKSAERREQWLVFWVIRPP